MAAKDSVTESAGRIGMSLVSCSATEANVVGWVNGNHGVAVMGRGVCVVLRVEISWR